MKDVGKIEITLEDISYEATERCRRIIHLLFEQGVFNIKNGEAIISFDEVGNPGSIRFNYVKWKNNKPDVPFANLYKNARIEVTKPDIKKA